MSKPGDRPVEPSQSPGSDGVPLPETPTEGQLYIFRTRPLLPSSPRETGRYAAFKVLGVGGVDGRWAAIAALDGIWTSPPTAAEMAARSVLHERRFDFSGKPAVFAVGVQAWRPGDGLDAVRIAGEAPVSDTERALAAVALRRGAGSRIATVGAVDAAAEGEWRWAHDRAALVAEAEERDARREAERAEAARRHRARLKALTFDQLLAEDPFAAWVPSPPFPPEDVKRRARDAVHGACAALRALGEKPRRPAVRAILKGLVEWFNEADGSDGFVIMTLEREHICHVMWEMLHVARQTPLADEIELWRDW